jgi:DUF1365 family protein
VTASGLYTGTVRHRRVAEAPHAFAYRVAMHYVDLDELPHLLGGRLVAPRPGLVRFRRRDFLGDPRIPLADAVRALVAERTGAAPDGPVRLLTHLRTLGHVFNPVSFYYCFDGAERLAAVVAEVTNTPWGERHAYVLPRGDDEGVLRGSMEKRLHVSPFMDMDQRYAWRATAPGETLSVHIANHQAGEVAFEATLALRREPLTATALARATRRYPAASLRILALIYGHAVALRLRGVGWRPHPREAAA